MQSKKAPVATSKTTAKDVTRLSDKPLFERDNLRWMLAGAVVLIIGFLLMAGGGSDDPNVFDKTQVYSFRRITIAPIVILLGFVIEIIAIFHQPKRSES